MIKKEMVNVYPIRYKQNELEFLMIKRATLSYNWQCVTGSVGNTMGAKDHPTGETPIECAIRELFEETGYNPAVIHPLSIPHTYFTEIKENEGEQTPPQLHEKLKEITFHNFIAQIDEQQDPVLNPNEHTDWKWCSFKEAYEIIKWAVEKQLLKVVYAYIIQNPLK